MRLLTSVAALVTLLVAIAGCGGVGTNPELQVSSQLIDGATFEIADVAVYSNCLSITFSVRGFRPASGVDPQAYFPPAKTIGIQVSSSEGELGARLLGGGGGGGGNEEDGRLWMEQEGLYLLEDTVPEGAEITVHATVALDDDFGSPEPLRFQIPIIAGPGGGDCQ
jgi:hypothetical protein